MDAGKCKFGMPSTVVDASSESVKVLREGPVSTDEIEKTLKKAVP